MDGFRTENSDAEKAGGGTATGVIRRVGRASMSFSLTESRWLYAVTVAVLTKDSAKLAALAKDPIGQAVAQKAQRLKYSAETPAEGT